jgi:hypothetical protein
MGKGPGAGASRRGHEPQQPGGALPGPRPIRGGRASLPAGTGDPEKGPGPGAVPFSNNGRQQWPLHYRNRGPIASVAVSHLGEFQGERIPESSSAEAKIRAIVQPRRLDDSLYGFAFLNA